MNCKVCRGAYTRSCVQQMLRSGFSPHHVSLQVNDNACGTHDVGCMTLVLSVGATNDAHPMRTQPRRLHQEILVEVTNGVRTSCGFSHILVTFGWLGVDY